MSSKISWNSNWQSLLRLALPAIDYVCQTAFKRDP